MSARSGRLATGLWDSYVRQTRDSNRGMRAKELSRAGKRGAWRRWHRDKQILDLLPMVERIAKNVRWMFAAYIDIRDLKQAGNVGLVAAANAYDPARGAFEPYAWFRVRGAIIDSQKRKVYREELNVSMQAISEAHDGWLPAALDTDRRELPDVAAQRAEMLRVLGEAIEGLPDLERAVLRRQMDGDSLTVTAKAMGRSVASTRDSLAWATWRVGARVKEGVAWSRARHVA